eukprot:TRINITY_DN17906_c0_g1_i1.p1 TRINITY_DN17906_c0_g1~~TRINITY_DN17906_c0_g1_i1.p1  ORF type:complete len:519 (-),score=48.36 TRINITY_DN17906_c0_g1_i1:14-1570(-)
MVRALVSNCFFVVIGFCAGVLSSVYFLFQPAGGSVKTQDVISAALAFAEVRVPTDATRRPSVDALTSTSTVAEISSTTTTVELKEPVTLAPSPLRAETRPRRASCSEWSGLQFVCGDSSAHGHGWSGGSKHLGRFGRPELCLAACELEGPGCCEFRSHCLHKARGVQRSSSEHKTARVTMCKKCATCTDCSRGFFLAGDKCQACPSKCSYCVDAGACIICEDGYYKASDGACKACPGKCSTCSDASTCITCNEVKGYYMNAAGSCEAKCDFADLVGSNPDWPLQLQSKERQFFSQNGEAGILVYIFQNVGVTDKYYMEFGVESGNERNTRFLQERCGWHGELMDGGYNRPEINLTKAFITPSAIGDLFKARKVPLEFDLLSIDIDTTDLWIWQNLAKKHGYKPRVVVTEVNSNYGKDEFWTFPNDPNVRWEGDCLMGASLAAFNLLAEEIGYSLVGTDSAFINAFWVRNDVLQKSGATAKGIAALHPRPVPIHAPCSEARKRLRVNFKEYVEQQKRQH